MQLSPPYVVRITPADVGRRVSVRSRLAETGPGAPSSTDTVGRLLDWADDRLTIEKRDGTRVEIAVTDVLAGKVIPEAPVRRERSTLPSDRSVEGP